MAEVEKALAFSVCCFILAFRFRYFSIYDV
jgi:hypothetical protein